MSNEPYVIDIKRMSRKSPEEIARYQERGKQAITAMDSLSSLLSNYHKLSEQADSLVTPIKEFDTAGMLTQEGREKTVALIVQAANLALSVVRFRVDLLEHSNVVDVLANKVIHD